MTIEIIPGKAHGSVRLPPSKSYAHRMILAGALAAGETVLQNFSPCEDTLATLDCAAALGAKIAQKGSTLVLCAGDKPSSAVFPCRGSGSTLRFFLPVALSGGGVFRFTGSERLFARGVGVYEALPGVALKKQADGLTASGRLRPGAYVIPGDVSSQLISGLLFALPLLSGGSTLAVTPPVESRGYIAMTIEVLRRFGIAILEQAPNQFLIRGGQTYRAAACTLEADWSAAAFLNLLNYFGGSVRLDGLPEDSAQADAAFERLLNLPGDFPIDLSDCPDLAPALFAAAAYRGGGVFTGTRRLRLKESDRAAAMAQELSKFGIRVEVFDNRVMVHGGRLQKPREILCGHNDHRVVMALAALSTVTGGTISGCEAAAKSYPDFFCDLKSLGLTLIE